MAAYEIAHALGPTCYVRPVVKCEQDDHESDGDDELAIHDFTLLGDAFAELSTEHGEMELPNEKLDYMREVLGESERWKPSKVTWINPEQAASKAAQSVIMAVRGPIVVMVYAEC